MLIHLSELSQAEGKKQSVPVVYDHEIITIGGVEYSITDKGGADFLMLCPEKGMIHVECDYSITATAPCDRCLAEVKIPISVTISEDIDVGEMGTELDTDELLYKEILMKWPMKVLCKEACKGICLKCGANLNDGECGCDRTALDPRMAAILDVFNNSNN